MIIRSHTPKAQQDPGREAKPAALARGLYGIADTIVLARDLVAGGAPVVQLRDKQASGRELLEKARALRVLTRESGTLFIVNDRLDIALMSEADGVHLGQDDLPLEAARSVARQVGRSDLLIGVSTHELAQVNAAEQSGADYIGFGPIFSTTTKADALSPRGLTQLAEAVRAFSGPVVAIGGITRATVSEVAATGAAMAAIIGDVVQANDCIARVRELQSVLAR